MKNTLSSLHVLRLSKKETKILDLFQANQDETPVTLAKKCSIPRPTIYLILEKLEERGLIYSLKYEKRKLWRMTSNESLSESMSKLKSGLIADNKAYEKLNITDNTDITIYKGEEVIAHLLSRIIDKNSGNRLLGIQGDKVGDAWKDTFSLKNINALNKKITDQKLITEMISSEEFFKQQIKLFGKTWAENFMGRATQMHFIDNRYLDYESQIFLFEDQLFLVSMRESLFIEVKNKHISKLIISLLKFVEDHSSLVDVNKLLREMTNQSKKL